MSNVTNTQASDKCQFCHGRFIIPPGFNRTTWRSIHEKECDLSVDCHYCIANKGQWCSTANGKRTNTHSNRRLR